MKKAYIKIITLILLAINAAVWILFAVLYYFVVDKSGVSNVIAAEVSLLLFIDGIFYTLSIYGILKKIKPIYLFSIILVLGNAVLSVCDEIGVIDVSMCAINVIIFVLLLIQRKSILIKGGIDEKS